MKILIMRDNKLIEASFNNFKFEDTGKGWVNIDADNIRVLVDGEEKETYGDSFAGHKFYAADVFASIVEGYINSNNSVEFIEVPEEVKMAKALFWDDIELEGRLVPRRIIYNRDILELQAASNGFSDNYKAKNPHYSKKYKGEAVYLNIDLEKFVLTDSQNAVLTDVENFWISGVLQIAKKDNIVYGKEFLENMVKIYEE